MSTTFCLFFFNDTATTEIYTLSLHDALPISATAVRPRVRAQIEAGRFLASLPGNGLDRRLDVAALRAMAQRVIHQHAGRSEEHTSELQSRLHLVCRPLLEKKKETLRSILPKC